MAQFITRKDIQVNKASVLTIVNSMEKGQDTRRRILTRNGINLQEGKTWYNLQNFLNAYRDIAESIGSMNIFLIGKVVIDNSEFPPMKDIEEALGSINIAYDMNHGLNDKPLFDPATGKMQELIGGYHLKSFDAQAVQLSWFVIIRIQVNLTKDLLRKL